MTEYTTTALLKTKKEIIQSVEEGKLGVKTASSLLGMTRQGLLKLRRNYRLYGNRALVGRKRGPKFCFRVHNRTPEWIEEEVGNLYMEHGVGPDSLLWVIEDTCHDIPGWVELSRSTIYRILVRIRLLKPKAGKKKNPHPGKYTKGYPGEEVQVDTTEPFGKSKGILLNLVDDYSRWKGSYFYPRNSSLNAKRSLQHFLVSAPFPVHAVRVDNGSEFKKHFAAFCKENRIRLTRNTVRTPEHNGKVERLHRTVEEECLWRIQGEQQDNGELVSYALAQHTMWYNSKRRHLGYKMDRKTPQQKIENWIINNQPPIEFTKEVNETLILYKT